MHKTLLRQIRRSLGIEAAEQLQHLLASLADLAARGDDLQSHLPFIVLPEQLYAFDYIFQLYAFGGPVYFFE